jgi:hypothetical protein
MIDKLNRLGALTAHMRKTIDKDELTAPERVDAYTMLDAMSLLGEVIIGLGASLDRIAAALEKSNLDARN